MFLYLIDAFTHTDMVGSNLTFGAGGKDKDGNNVTGYGYYEVCFGPAF